MLSSAVAVVSQYGYEQMSVARVTGGAGVSRRTFYDLFEDREDCFLAVFEDAVTRAAELVIAAHQRERSWREQVRSALAVLLCFLEEEPGLRLLLVVDSLKAGRRVQARRVEVLGQLSRVLQEGGSGTGSGRAIPPLTGECIVGALCSVIHTRLLQEDPGRMLDLLNPLMGMIVLPYLGPAAAQRELERPAPIAAATPRARAPVSNVVGDPLAGLPMRITYRTLRVLTAIGENPGASNREVATQGGVSDQGQISKLLGRLERLGLIHNGSQGQPSGEPNAWRLTPQGQEVEHSIQARPSQNDSQENGKRGWV